MKWLARAVLAAIATAACNGGDGSLPADISGRWSFFFADTDAVIAGVPSLCGVSYIFDMSQRGGEVAGKQAVIPDFHGVPQYTGHISCYPRGNVSAQTDVIQTGTTLYPGTMNGNTFAFAISASGADATGSLTVDSTGQRLFAGTATLNITIPGGSSAHLNALWVAYPVAAAGNP